MTQFELKERLIKKINLLEDDFLLTEIYSILENDDDKIFPLNDLQKKNINVASKQIEDGLFLTNEHANLEIKQWLQ